MPDKKLERWYLERLKAVLPDFPAGEVECTESPDFLIHGPEGVVGVEITVYHSQPQSGASALSDAAGNRVCICAWPGTP